MRVGDFELCIVNGLETPGTGQAQLRHGQVYQLGLSNHSESCCEAVVKIDGKSVGCWRVPSKQSIVLERPVDQAGKFTFFRLDSAEAKHTGIRRGSDLGLVHVAFIPEKPLFEGPSLLYAANPEPIGEHEIAGGTALTGKSEQLFRSASDSFDHDYSRTVEISIRLTCEPTDPRERMLAEIARLKSSVFNLEVQIRAERADDCYLAPEHMEKMDQLMDAKIALCHAQLRQQFNDQFSQLRKDFGISLKKVSSSNLDDVEW